MPRGLPDPILQNPGALKKRIANLRTEDTLGDLVLWRIQDIEIPPDDLEALLKKRGIDTDWMPTPIRSKTAARKAISKIRVELEDDKLKVLMRKVVDNDDEVRYALINEETDIAKLALDYSERNQVIFDKHNAKITFKGPEIKEIKDKFDYYCQVYTQAEISRMLKNIMSRHGLSMEDGSGMFFMPSVWKNLVTSLGELVNFDLNGNYGSCWFRPLGITDSDRDKETMQNVVLHSLKSEIREAQESVDQALSTVDQNTRGATAALKKFNSLKAKAVMYKDLMSLEIKDLDKTILTAQDKLKTALGVDEDKAA